MSITLSRKPHHWFRFSLRTLMLLVLVIGLLMGWLYNGAESQRKAVATLKKNRGAIVLYDYESSAGLKKQTATPWAPAWLRRNLGDDYFQKVTYANMTADSSGTYKLTDTDLEPLEDLRGSLGT